MFDYGMVPVAWLTNGAQVWDDALEIFRPLSLAEFRMFMEDPENIYVEASGIENLETLHGALTTYKSVPVLEHLGRL